MKKKLLIAGAAAMLLIAAAVLALTIGDNMMFRDINGKGKFVIATEHVASYKSEVGTEYEWYRQMQGSCTDGKYAYLMLRNGKIDKNSVWKINLKDYSVVNKVYDAPIDHGNDAIYNPRLNKVVICNAAPNEKVISFLDPDTLEVTESRRLPRTGLYCISYNAKRDQYVLGENDGYFAVTDADFKTVSMHQLKKTGWITQGSDCDDKYIYFPQWDSETMQNYLLVYDWEGNYVNTVEILTDKELEVESLFHIGDDVYICFNTEGGHMYKAQLQKAE